MPSSIFFADEETFSEHLAQKKSYILDSLSSLFKELILRKNDEVPEEKIQKLHNKVSELLASEKSHRAEIERISNEKEEVETQLATAAFRYLSAEKKLDRFKSVTLQKIEQQAVAGSAAQQNDKSKSNSAGGSKSQITEGQLADADLARKEAEAITTKQDTDIKHLQSENSRLSEQITKYIVKVSQMHSSLCLYTSSEPRRESSPDWTRKVLTVIGGVS